MKLTYEELDDIVEELRPELDPAFYEELVSGERLAKIYEKYTQQVYEQSFLHNLINVIHHWIRYEERVWLDEMKAKNEAQQYAQFTSRLDHTSPFARISYLNVNPS